MPSLHVLRVFVNEEGEWGNPLGVLLDGGEVPERRRPALAAELGFSETVFVDDRSVGRIRIHTPEVELPFAGHPTVGVAWLLAREGTPVSTLRTAAGEVDVRLDDALSYIAAPPQWAPRFEYIQLDSPAQVRTLGIPRDATRNVYAWAWIDEAAGTIRARSFVPLAGIEEDEATGSAALALCARLERAAVIHQGHGSVLLVRPSPNGRVEVGGRVVLDEVRDIPAGDRS